MLDQIFSYREMCESENVQTLQRGMNVHLNPLYSLILMSRRSNAPYKDKVAADGITIYYEGHDEIKRITKNNPKLEDQPDRLASGKLTQNGLFIKAIDKFKSDPSKRPEIVKVYEKIMVGVWSLKGFFDLIDYEKKYDGQRNVFRFILRFSKVQSVDKNETNQRLSHTRLIPSEVKKEVWKRDKGKCAICGETKNLHFDHDLPYSKGGTSLSVKNIKLLCMKHNLMKSDKLE